MIGPPQPKMRCFAAAAACSMSTLLWLQLPVGTVSSDGGTLEVELFENGLSEGGKMLTVAIGPLAEHWTTKKGFDPSICLGTYLAELAIATGANFSVCQGWNTSKFGPRPAATAGGDAAGGLLAGVSSLWGGSRPAEGDGDSKWAGCRDTGTNCSAKLMVLPSCQTTSPNIVRARACR